MLGDTLSGAGVSPALGANTSAPAMPAEAMVLDLPLRRDGISLRRGGADASGLALAISDGIPVVPDDTVARRLQLALKRGCDIVLSLAALILLSPLLIAVALIIATTSRGKVLFRQKRDGLNGRTIEVYKFRSMYEDRGDLSGVAQTVKDDPRVTPIGRVIRRTSIDELPQLFNILRGDMSVIGPRPHPIGMRASGMRYDELVPYYHLRHVVKPGLSGWAQANGYRGPTDDAMLAARRIEHDLAYVQHFSLWLDLRIILMTLKSEFLQGSGS